MLGRDFAWTQANNTRAAMVDRCRDSAAAISGFGRTTRATIGSVREVQCIAQLRQLLGVERTSIRLLQSTNRSLRRLVLTRVSSPRPERSHGAVFAPPRRSPNVLSMSKTSSNREFSWPERTIQSRRSPEP
jgi:hypothetical protein